MIEQRHDGDRRRRLVEPDQRIDGGVTRQQVVDAGRGQQLAVVPEATRGLQAVQHQVERHHFLGIEAVLGRTERLEERRRLPEAPHGRHVALAVEDQSGLGDVTIQVDGQLGHPHTVIVVAYQANPTVAEYHPAGHSQVTVQPRVEQDAPVHLHAELAVSGCSGVGPRFQAQVGTVGVGSDDAKALAGRVPVTEHPRDHGAIAHHQVAARFVGPAVDLGQRDETLVVEAPL